MRVDHLKEVPLAVFIILGCGCRDKAGGVASSYCHLAIDTEDGISKAGYVQIGQSFWFDLDKGAC